MIRGRRVGGGGGGGGGGGDPSRKDLRAAVSQPRASGLSQTSRTSKLSLTRGDRREGGSDTHC